MTSKSTFSAWREKLGLSIEEASDLLGLGRGQICILNRGYDGLGRPAVPGKDTRLLMSAVEQGIRLRPVPLNEAELAAQKAIRKRRIIAQRKSFEAVA